MIRSPGRAHRCTSWAPRCAPAPIAAKSIGAFLSVYVFGDGAGARSLPSSGTDWL